jgi:hypothetical protein
MSNNYTWIVNSVDTSTHTMVVTYTYGDTPPISINVSLPPVGEDVAFYIESLAPVHQWNPVQVEYQTVDVNLSGTSTYSTPVVNLPNFSFEEQVAKLLLKWNVINKMPDELGSTST